MPKKNDKPPTIRDTSTIDTHDELQRIAEANQQRNAEIEREQKARTERAKVARERLAQSKRGAESLARVEDIIANRPDLNTIELGDDMDSAVRAAESFAERYNVTNGSCVSTALHMTAPMLSELQKVTLDALHRCAGWFTSHSDGAGALGDTHNPDGADMLTAPVVYASSRPGERWVIGPSQSFDDIVSKLVMDCHCDLSVEPFAKKLERFYTIGSDDCVAEMREEVDRHKKLVNYATTHKDPSLLPSENLSLGLLFPVVFGNQIVFLKFCTGHWSALVWKYEIQIRECAVVEPWEAPGNHW